MFNLKHKEGGFKMERDVKWKGYSPWIEFSEDKIKQIGESYGIYVIGLGKGIFVPKVKELKTGSSRIIVGGIDLNQIGRVGWQYFDSNDARIIPLRRHLNQEGKCFGEYSVGGEKLIEGTICVYIGKAEDQLIKERLLQHFRNPQNPCLKKLMEKNIPLIFKTKSIDPQIMKKNAIPPEEEAYRYFFGESNQCPPCDCKSNECQKLGLYSYFTQIGEDIVC